MTDAQTSTSVEETTENRKAFDDQQSSFVPVPGGSNVAWFLPFQVLMLHRVLAATLCQETPTAATAKHKENAAVMTWRRLVFRTELVSKALQCQQILIQFEIEAQRWNQEALLRATNSTLEAKKHHTKGESNSNCAKGEQLKPSMTLRCQPTSETGAKPICDTVHGRRWSPERRWRR